MANTSQPLSAYSPDTCMFCHQSLRITIGTTESDLESEQLDREEAETIIDDVELYCGPPGSGPSGHHAHWACLIDRAKRAPSRAHGVPPDPLLPLSGPSTSAPLLTTQTCAVCGQNTLDASGRFLVDVRNEGGETTGFDFGEILDEELFLDANPAQLHVRAFHDLVAEGDYVGAIELIAEHDVDLNCTYGSDGLTALQKALFNGDTSGVQFLRSLGATV